MGWSKVRQQFLPGFPSTATSVGEHRHAHLFPEQVSHEWKHRQIRPIVYKLLKQPMGWRSAVDSIFERWCFTNGFPLNHPFLDGFSILNQPFWGIPIYGKPPYVYYNLPLSNFKGQAATVLSNVLGNPDQWMPGRRWTSHVGTVTIPHLKMVMAWGWFMAMFFPHDSVSGRIFCRTMTKQNQYWNCVKRVHFHVSSPYSLSYCQTFFL